MATVEERMRDVEKQLNFFKGAFVVSSAILLPWLGYTSFYRIPQTVSEQINEKVGFDVTTSLKKIKADSDALEAQFADIRKEPKETLKSLKLENVVKYDDPINLKLTGTGNEYIRNDSGTLKVSNNRFGTWSNDRTFIVQKKDQEN
jgi:hypothetical protein